MVKSSVRVAVQSVCLLAGLWCAPWVQAQPESQPDYKNTALDFEVRAKDLVARMTLEEKVSQLINDAPAIPRLGVREYNWWNEGLHGVAAAGDATVFPQAIGMAATWNAPLMRQIADVISIEFRAKHLAEQHRFGGSDWFAGLTVWSPNINIFRDPRWGRGQETYGEDPYLTSRLGVAFVQGLQGDDPRYLRTVATPKHYAVHSGPEPNRHREDVYPSPRDLHETYLPAFEATVKEGGAVSIMCAYNAVDGVPACASANLMTATLRDAWGFNGYVVSDCEAVSDIYKQEHHGFTATSAQGVAVAFKAGMDLICGSPDEIAHIHEALEQKLLTEAELEQSLVRLFTARMRLGQFDPRHAVFPKITARDNDTEAHRALALRTAQESLVLLKNRDNFLPFRDGVKSLAVIGPNADSLDALVGNYNGSPSQPVTVLQGLQKRFGAAAIVYERGVNLLAPLQTPVPDSALCQDKKCRKPGLTASFFNGKDLTVKPLKKAAVANAGVHWEGEVKSGAMRWEGFINAPQTGRYTFRYEAHGGYRIWVGEALVIDAWNVDWRPTIASGAIDLKAGERYSLRVESFQRGEDGNEHLVWSLPSDPAAARAVTAAQQADAVVFVAGLTAQVEGEEMPVDVPGFSGGDRTDLGLPQAQLQLLERVLATGKPVVVVLINGSPLSIPIADQQAAAIVEAWYPGGEGGDAIAGLLAGDFSPAGRLPLTFYRSVDDLPPFNDYSMANRTYRYFKGEALYPFGYGLSYTSFSYSAATLSTKKYRGKGTVTVTATVTNSGAMAGDEVIQLYLAREDIPDAPLRSLVGFQRIHLAPGESRKVTFQLTREQLASVTAGGKRELIPGDVSLWLGGGQPLVPAGLPKPAGVETRLSIARGAK